MRFNLLTTLLVAALLVLATLSLRQCHRTKQAETKLATAKALTARQQRQLDSLANHLHYALAWAKADSTHTSGQRAAQSAYHDETRVRATPSRSWSVDSLTRFLANPFGLHAPGASR